MSNDYFPFGSFYRNNHGSFIRSKKKSRGGVCSESLQLGEFIFSGSLNGIDQYQYQYSDPVWCDSSDHTKVWKLNTVASFDLNSFVFTSGHYYLNYVGQASSRSIIISLCWLNSSSSIIRTDSFLYLGTNPRFDGYTNFGIGSITNEIALPANVSGLKLRLDAYTASGTKIITNSTAYVTWNLSVGITLRKSIDLWYNLTSHTTMYPANLGSNNYRYVKTVSSTPLCPSYSREKTLSYGKNLTFADIIGCAFVPTTSTPVTGGTSYEDTVVKSLNTNVLDESYNVIGSALLVNDCSFYGFMYYNNFRGLFVDVDFAVSISTTKNNYSGKICGVGSEAYINTPMISIINAFAKKMSY